MSANQGSYSIVACNETPYYLITQVESGKTEVIKSSDGEAMHFNSIVVAQQWLADRGVHEATLAFETAYDEMIGCDTSSTTSHYTMESHF